MPGPQKVSGHWPGVSSIASRPANGYGPRITDHSASRFTFHVFHSALRTPHSALRTGFTLIELMVVMGIMAILMTMGVPLVYRTTHKLPMSRAVTDVVEVCSNARARAILHGAMTEVVFHPMEKRLEIAGAAGGAPPAEHPGDGSGEAGAARAPGSGLSAQLDERVDIDMLDINLTEYSRSELARVRFYPNGTCDEMTLILRARDGGEQRGIVLEITTGLASVLSENDLQNLRNGRL
jgi:prepilin-type N-terminal cleavage/methylation domain-containing protein